MYGFYEAITKRYGRVNFKTFVKYVLRTRRVLRIFLEKYWIIHIDVFSNGKIDAHWRPQHERCPFCGGVGESTDLRKRLNYDLLGEITELREDLTKVLDFFHLSKFIPDEILQEHFNSAKNGRELKTVAKYERVKNYFKRLSIKYVERLCKLYKADFEMFQFDPIFPECGRILEDPNIWPTRLERALRVKLK